MGSQPTRPFQEAREFVKSHLALAAGGAADQVQKMVFTYRVSGGPPGKRLLQVFRVTVRGDATYEYHDELKSQKAIRLKMRLSKDDVRSLLRQVQDSGILDVRESGGGFLPDSVIGSIGIESDGAQVTYHFLAEEHQQISQNKTPPPPIQGLALQFERLLERARKAPSPKALQKKEKRR